MIVGSLLLNHWIEMFGIRCYIKAKIRAGHAVHGLSDDDASNIEFKDMLRTIRVMKGTMAGENESLGILKEWAQKQLRLSTIEFSLFVFAIHHPRLFLKYVSDCLYPVYKEVFYFNEQDRKKLFFVHNFIGAKTAILLLIVKFIREGKKSLIYVDEPVFDILWRMYGVLVKSMGCHYPDLSESNKYEFVLKAKYFEKYFGSNCRKSEIRFLNSKKKENLLRALHYFKKENYYMVLIPETAVETKRKIKLEFLGREILLSGGIEILLRYADSVISLLPDASESLMRPKFLIEESPVDEDTVSLMQSIIKRCERLSFVKPELYLPFNYSSMWKNLYPDEKETDKSIVDILSWKEKCLVLLSDGQFLIGKRSQLKEFI